MVGAGVSSTLTVKVQLPPPEADDVIVCVPVAALMADAATLMAPDGMLVLFAGVPNGTLAPLNLSDVYLNNAQFTGTSGSAIDDQATVIRKTTAGELSPNRSVAAVGGIEAALLLGLGERLLPGRSAGGPGRPRRTQVRHLVHHPSPPSRPRWRRRKWIDRQEYPR